MPISSQVRRFTHSVILRLEDKWPGARHEQCQKSATTERCYDVLESP